MPRQYSVRCALNRESAPSHNTTVSPIFPLRSQRSACIFLRCSFSSSSPSGPFAPWYSLDRHSFSTISPCDNNSAPLLTVAVHDSLPADRLFWVALRAVWTDWIKPLAVARPAPVVAWHRRAYRAYWGRISVGTCRRELLDHVIVLNETHVQRLLQEFLYHEDRTHLSLGMYPTRRAVCPQPSPLAAVASISRVGGLHHR